MMSSYYKALDMSYHGDVPSMTHKHIDNNYQNIKLPQLLINQIDLCVGTSVFALIFSLFLLQILHSNT